MLIFNFFILSIGKCSTKSIIYVDDDVDRDYNKIQNAINAASNGDTIYIYNGTYYENIIINKSINLIGEDKNTTILDGGRKDNVIKITANGVVVTGFTVQKSISTIENMINIAPKAGINISSNNNTITDNLLINNSYGMTLFHASNNMISKNIISDDDHCGIYMSNSQNNIITNNIIKNNYYNGIGIYDKSNTNTITENTLMNNNNCGIKIRLSSNNNITDNNLIGNKIGICEPVSKYKNYITNNIFSGNTNDIEKEFEIPVYLMLLVIIGTSLLAIVIFYLEQKRQKKETHGLEKTTYSLDTRGNLCPVPLIMTKKKIKKMNKGGILEIITDDLVAKENIERYAEEKHSLVRIEEKNNIFKIYIKK